MRVQFLVDDGLASERQTAVDGTGEHVVDVQGGGGDSRAMPTISDLLNAYRDRTGHSYDEMARRTNDEMRGSRIQQLTVNKPAVKAFPDARTVELLSQLLEVPIATTVLAFASSLGLSVRDSAPTLAQILPPGTDNLTPQDRDAILAVIRQLVAARNAAGHGTPDLSRLQALRLSEEESTNQAPIRNGDG